MIQIIPMIPYKLLKDYGVVEKKYEKQQLIFNENEEASFYYQIKEGGIKMFNLTEEGKEFTQGYFEEHQSFGEPPLLGDFLYPASAVATKVTVMYVLSKQNFIDLLKAYPEVHLALTTLLCNRIHYKAMLLKEVSIHTPEHRIITLLRHLKAASDCNTSYEIRLTRQQISELTGLRVETVIRAIKKLEKNGELQIINRKVYV